jgi:hypothetical protein
MFNLKTQLKKKRICGQFYWWRKLEYPEETISLLKVTEKHNQVHLIIRDNTTYSFFSDDRN